MARLHPALASCSAVYNTNYTPIIHPFYIPFIHPDQYTNLHTQWLYQVVQLHPALASFFAVQTQRNKDITSLLIHHLLHLPFYILSILVIYTHELRHPITNNVTPYYAAIHLKLLRLLLLLNYPSTTATITGITSWWRGVAVTRFILSTKLLYAGLG